MTAQRDIGLVGLLIILISWPDISYSHGLVAGLPAVGYDPNYGAFPVQPADHIPLSEVFEGWQEHNAMTLAKLRPGKDDTFALTQSETDASKDFCTQPMTMAQLLRVTKGKPYTLIPRHVITQSSGKQRVIDDAARGGQSERSQDANKLVLCTPFRPAQHIALVAHFTPAAEWTAMISEDPWQGAGDDWRDAYRQSPISPEEALGCVVCFWHHKWNAPAFQIYNSLLFGLPRILVSMYFEDAHITDKQSSGASAQWAIYWAHLLHLTRSKPLHRKPAF